MPGYDTLVSALETRFDFHSARTLANEAKGDGGFGYDPAFIPDGYCTTFGQLPGEVKNSLSHRARALEGLTAYLAAMV